MIDMSKSYLRNLRDDTKLYGITGFKTAKRWKREHTSSSTLNSPLNRVHPYEGKCGDIVIIGMSQYYIFHNIKTDNQILVYLYNGSPRYFSENKKIIILCGRNNDVIVFFNRGCFQVERYRNGR